MSRPFIGKNPNHRSKWQQKPDRDGLTDEERRLKPLHEIHNFHDPEENERFWREYDATHYTPEHIDCFYCGRMYGCECR